MKKLVYILICIGLLTSIFAISSLNPAEAQFPTTEGVDTNSGLPAGVAEQLSVTVTPKFPEPGQTVSVQIESFSTNLNNARIAWYNNGTQIISGMGKTIQTFTAPLGGQSLNLSVVINKEEGGVLEKSIVIQPASVDILYEAQTYTPPFYQGKSIFTNQASVKVIAEPSLVRGGRLIPADELVYKWEKNGTVLQDKSGYGRRTAFIEGDLVSRPMNITVTVTSPNSSLQARKTITLNTYEPELLLYEENPVLGTLLEQTLSGGQFLLTRPEVEINAVPYFYSVTFPDSSRIKYGWNMNGETFETDPQQYTVTFRNETKITGTTNISATARHTDNLLQASRSTFLVDTDAELSGEGEEFEF